jgi:hypothetical protein
VGLISLLQVAQKTSIRENYFVAGRYLTVDEGLGKGPKGGRGFGEEGGAGRRWALKRFFGKYGFFSYLCGLEK